MFSPIPRPTEAILLVVKFGSIVCVSLIIFARVSYLVESMSTPRNDDLD